jgi:hypothetical protein
MGPILCVSRKSGLHNLKSKQRSTKISSGALFSSDCDDSISFFSENQSFYITVETINFNE